MSAAVAVSPLKEGSPMSSDAAAAAAAGVESRLGPDVDERERTSEEKQDSFYYLSSLLLIDCYN